jgi:hypothetical protein
MTTTFVVERASLHRTRWMQTEPAAFADGDVRLRIESFALTSNNITYAAFGQAMNYWGFFPTGDVTTGCIPVWGFATVVDSRCENVNLGERFYGYFAIATDVLLQPVRIDAAGFSDGAAQRRELHAVYNQYARCSTDPGYRPDREAEQALLRPLFITSFLIDDFLAENLFFGAKTAILSSASSKTAYGTAFCLAQRRAAPEAVRIIGLTSRAHLDFARGLGCYDDVLAYDALRDLPAQVPTLYVDFSGSARVRFAVHSHFCDRLAYSCSVGATHWEEIGSGKGLPGPRPKLFFAPAQVKKRHADGGAAALQQRIAAAWSAFLEPVTGASQPWMRVVRGHGQAAVEAAYSALLNGTLDPREGHVLGL